ncbi:MAG: DUF6272 family protein [Microcoleaceae cyanobacterium MO_207.B10]|nr:DUF6272 family protein [Microcoleaceae cyanobacterium MO_207.B10]
MSKMIFGNFLDNLSELGNNIDSLELSFSPSSRPIKQRWRNNRLSAHFVADYLSTFFPMSDDDPNSERRKKQSIGAVSYVANELLENAMKFNNDDFEYRIRFGIYFMEEPEIKVVLFATNSINTEQSIQLKQFIQDLTESDPDELYIRQLEKSAEDENEDVSGLGLITMVNDYDAKLGWQFSTVAKNPEIQTVTTMAQIPV